MDIKQEPLAIRKPKWLTTQLPTGKTYLSVREIVHEHKLHTICESGKCPNMGECWGAGTATFMIMGEICTRSCQFCNVKTGRPLPLDLNEPTNLANSIRLMKLKHAVLTSVDRDDLPDGGAGHWATVVQTIRTTTPEVTLETLIPDFQGHEWQIDKIIEVHPEVVSHNLETVERLTREVRIQAKYSRSLGVLRYLKKNGITTKSGLMLGLGETQDEVHATIRDLHEAGCDILTMGQYLQPSKKHLSVQAFITPEQFEAYKVYALEVGIRIVESGPLVRSSYHAEKQIEKL
jgi:lipoic acid synthetase